MPSFPSIPDPSISTFFLSISMFFLSISMSFPYIRSNSDANVNYYQNSFFWYKFPRIAISFVLLCEIFVPYMIFLALRTTSDSMYWVNWGWRGSWSDDVRHSYIPFPNLRFLKIVILHILFQETAFLLHFRFEFQFLYSSWDLNLIFGIIFEWNYFAFFAEFLLIVHTLCRNTGPRNFLQFSSVSTRNCHWNVKNGKLSSPN